MNKIILFIKFINLLINNYFVKKFLYEDLSNYNPFQILYKTTIEVGKLKKNINIYNK